MRLWVRRIVSGLVLLGLLAAGVWWSGLNCETRALTTPSANGTLNAPRTWTDFSLLNLARVVVVDAGWRSSVVEVEEVLWASLPAGGGLSIPGSGTAIEVENPVRYPGCAPKPGDRYLVSLSPTEGRLAYGSWLRIDPDGSLTVEGGIDPELDQRVFVASAPDGVLNSEAMVAFAADLAVVDRSTAQARIEAGEPLDRVDGTTQGPLDEAMVENLAMLAERGQQPNW